MKYKLFLFDIDGVFTDGGLYYTNTSDIIRKFHVQDGLGIRLLQHTAIVPVVVTGKRSEAVTQRMKVLGIDHVYQKVRNKLATVQEISEKFSVSLNEIIFMGDDWNDFPILEKVGCKITVPASPPEIQQICDYVTKKAGGDGAVREAIEWLLRKENLYESAVQEFMEYLKNHE